MTTRISTRITRRRAVALALVVGMFAAHSAAAASARREPNGTLRYYDDNGSDRGYAWCLTRGGSTFDTPACNYATHEQCRAAGSPSYDCTPNPWSYYTPNARPRD